jgi:hypothetical protein
MGPLQATDGLTGLDPDFTDAEGDRRMATPCPPTSEAREDTLVALFVCGRSPGPPPFLLMDSAEDCLE